MEYKKARAFPRRKFSKKVGVMAAGVYTICEGVDISEGGVRIAGIKGLKVKQAICMTFQLPGSTLSTMRGEVIKEVSGEEISYGVQFNTESMDHKTKLGIRLYVASRTKEEMQGEIKDKDGHLTQKEKPVAQTFQQTANASVALEKAENLKDSKKADVKSKQKPAPSKVA